MPAIVANAKKFLLSTDYQMDKIAYMTSGSLVVPASSFEDVVIPHGLPFTPLIQAVYSTNSSFTVAYEYNTGPILTDTAYPGVYAIDTSDESDSTNITLRHSNNSSSSVGIYYRIYAFKPTTSTADVDFTANTADSFTLNTDYNYPKLYLEGVTSYSGTPNSTETITHSLGYRPQVLAWEEYDTGEMYSKTFSSIQSSGATNTSSVKVSTTDVVYERDAFLFSGQTRLHYRIYLDE